MREGHVVQMGTPRELYCEPVDPFVVTFFDTVNELTGEVRGGRVATPVGEVAAPALAEGERARVMIRPEALRVEALAKPPTTTHSHVIMAKLLGRASLLHICAHGADGQEAHLHAGCRASFCRGGAACGDKPGCFTGVRLSRRDARRAWRGLAAPRA